MTTVLICPDADRECGHQPSCWCANCPKRLRSSVLPPSADDGPVVDTFDPAHAAPAVQAEGAQKVTLDDPCPDCGLIDWRDYYTGAAKTHEICASCNHRRPAGTGTAPTAAADGGESACASGTVAGHADCQILPDPNGAPCPSKSICALAATPSVAATAGQSECVAAVRPTDDALWDQTMRERDHYYDMADTLARGVAEHFGADIGEHSNANCPWTQALDLLNTKPEYINCVGSKYAAPAPAAAGVGQQDAAVREAAQLVLDEYDRMRGERMAAPLFEILRFALHPTAAPASEPVKGDGADRLVVFAHAALAKAEPVNPHHAACIGGEKGPCNCDAASTASQAVIIDTPAFRALLETWAHADFVNLRRFEGSHNAEKQARAAIIAHIDAWGDAKAAAARQEGDQLRSDVAAIVALLDDGEWAEHIASSDDGVALETAITNLVSKAAAQPAGGELAEDAARQGDQFARGVIAALAVVTAHDGPMSTMHRDILQACGEDAIYLEAEEEDYEWAGLDQEKKAEYAQRIAARAALKQKEGEA